MKKLNKNEYQSVILAGLLHDIGKFLNKPNGGDHSDPSGDFIRCNAAGLDELGFNTELVEKIARYHHFWKIIKENKGVYSELRPIRHFIDLVSLADRSSSKERKEQGGNNRGWDRNLLGNIFESIEGIKHTSVAQQYKKDKQDEYYSLNSLGNKSLHEVVFSKPLGEFEEKTLRDNYEDAIKDFKNDFDVLLNSNKAQKNLNGFNTSLYSLLHRYTRVVPSVAVGKIKDSPQSVEEIKDVSLFDHLRTTSAIAACLYIYMTKNGNIEKRYQYYTKKRDDKRFLLIGGDLSGIQNYLYEVTNIGPGGAAKRLRSRSLFVSTLIEVISHKLLKELDDDYELPISCKIISGGGNFIVLAPNLEQVRANIPKIEKKINLWLWQETQGELSITFDFVRLSSEDFEIKRVKKTRYSEPHDSRITEKLNELWDNIAQKKATKLSSILLNQDRWNENNFKWIDEKRPYNKLCHSCNKLPATEEDPFDATTNLCTRCHSDKKVGQIIPNSYKIAYFTARPSNDKKYWKFFDEYYVKISKEDETYTNPVPYLVERFGFDKHLDAHPTLIRPVAHYVPQFNQESFKNKKDFDDYCNGCFNREPCEKVFIKKNETGEEKKVAEFRKRILNELDNNEDPFPCLKTFSCLANKSKGEKLLGILKVDVDHLGLIFSIGLGQSNSISRIATLSRMVDLFFAGWIHETISKNFPDCYVVYSGGDDLLIVGPWSEVIELSKHINENFNGYVADNPNITLSAGISITKHKYPIAKSSKMADENLSIAKNEGRNRLRLFGTTVVWREVQDEIEKIDLDTLEYWKDFFGQRKQKDNKKIFLTAYIHKMLNIAETCKRFVEQGTVEDLRYMSRLAYSLKDFRRDLGKTDSPVTKEMFEKLFELTKKENQQLLAKFRLPLSWLLYERRGDNDES